MGAHPTHPETDFADSHARAIGDQSSQSTTRQQSLIRLENFQEVTCRVTDLDQDDQAVRIELSVGTLEYPIGSREAEISMEELSGQIGNRVSIIRTPSTTDPLRIHVLGSGK